MFRLPEAWVWDFWLADDGESYHLFFLYASRALGDPDARHHRASVGHAISTDLVHWERVRDALVRSDAPAFDDLATWTGSVVKHPDGTWFLFYTGATLDADGRNVQRIGYATSRDLTRWEKSADNPVLEADSRWYEQVGDDQWPDEAFRDPFVFRDPDGAGWHMLITARANNGPADDRGVIGHATSPDLRHWTIGPPLSGPGQGFGQLEVSQVEVIHGQPFIIFSCLDGEIASSRRLAGVTGGVWAATAGSLLGPYGINAAVQLTDRSLYSGRLIQERSTGDWKFMAFHHDGDSGAFVGEISDPLNVHVVGGVITLTHPQLPATA
ncbi:beta-fructofuranosidase [Nakamurella panacisegetis]|uniref:beta-fructofuranosidase n=1 Tax=Nakamurella panacisegetis TaxID=1090615 RepID=A0A1H0T032_9ACTN|nr:family 43 glycosylhydrolase [Nakamurella panacisegetis]SDP47413.1 beta-fructofuranosidase [Nakamurella panacisegetis]